jgi:tetratricopeptide (TPR) repeat protein
LKNNERLPIKNELAVKENDFVFDLVKSLDDRELRFVRSEAKSGLRPQESVLMLLEDMRGQEKYNPRRLKISYRQYEVVKFKLKHLILKALRRMESRQTIEQEITLHLENEAILYRKGLYQPATRELEAARTLAETHHRLALLLEILLLEQHRRIEASSKNLPEVVNAHVELILGVLGQYGQEIHTISDYQQSFARYRSHEKIVFGEQTAPDSSPQPIAGLPASFLTQLYHLLSESLTARSEGRLDGARDATLKALELFETFPEIRDRDPKRYKVLLANYAVYLIPDGRYPEINEIVTKMQDLEDKTFDGEAETFQNIAHLKLLVMLNTLDFAERIALFHEVSAGLEKFDHKINAARRFSIWYNQLMISIAAECYQEADELLSLIQGNKRIQVRQEVHYTARLLQLIVWYELESWDPPDKPIAALRQYLYRKEELTPFKQTVLGAVNRLTGTPESERRAVFEETAVALRNIQQDDSQNDELGLRMVAAWVASKLKKVSVRECLLE